MPTIRPLGEGLFSNGELRLGIRARAKNLRDAIAEMLVESLKDPASLDALAARHQLRVPRLNREDITTGQPVEVKVDARHLSNRRVVRESPDPRMVDGFRITMTVPFEGESGLFQVASSLVPNSPPVAEVQTHALLFVYELIEPQRQDLSVSFERELVLIEMFLEDLRRDAEPFNRDLASTIRELAESRLKRLGDMTDLVETLGYPLTRRTSPPTTFEVPIERRPLRPTAGDAQTSQEWHLSESDYTSIIGDLRRTAQIIEYSPSAFAKMGEEDIRWIFLIPLNLVYEGEAVGEAFNYGGKTDILLRKDGRSIFVAECLVWNGPKYLNEKIDQLLGYLSWRDNKAALLIFSRNRRFSEVLAKTKETLARHELHTRTIDESTDAAFRYELKRRDDPDRKVTLTVLCFDLVARTAVSDR